MKPKRRINLFGNRRDRKGDPLKRAVGLGALIWDSTDGLVYAVEDRRLERALRGAVADRVREGRYYVAAAVRRGFQVAGLRFDRIDDSMPEVLRCIAADDDLWARPHAGYQVSPVYREAKPAGRVNVRRARPRT